MGQEYPQLVEHRTPVIIVGAGPVGMLTAFELSRLGIECILAEMNLETTKWPKMDLTNCRSMEILRMMGIADEYRAQKGAVDENSACDSLFYTSCGPGGKLVTSWVRVEILSRRPFFVLTFFSSDCRQFANGVLPSPEKMMVHIQQSLAKDALKSYWRSG
jgi:hypothetical protein